MAALVNVLQGNVTRFQRQDVHVDFVPCHSIVTVETYYKAVKHSRMGHSSKLCNGPTPTTDELWSGQLLADDRCRRHYISGS